VTGAGPARARWWRPGVHLAGVLRRGRADRWLLLLTVLVLALTCALAVTAPRLVARTADEAVRDAVRDVGEPADLVVTVPFPDSLAGAAYSAVESASIAEQLARALPPELARLVQPPVASVATRVLSLGLPVDEQRGQLGLRLAWVWAGSEPAVTWVDGGAPGASPRLPTDVLGPVQVGLSEEGAATLGVGVGDVRTGRTSTGETVDVQVTGLFRAVDPDERVWTGVPALLGPRTLGAGRTAVTSVTGLLSADSLASARRTAAGPALTRSVVLPVDAGALDAATATGVPRAVAAFQAAPPSVGGAGGPRTATRLGQVVTQALVEVRTAQAQTTVVLTGVVAGAALTLLLTAQLLARRRQPVLVTQRARGAGLVSIAVEAAVESAALVAAGGAVGVLAGVLLVPGAEPVGWLVPVLAAGLLAGPVCGVLVASRATGGRRVPANRRQRRHARRDQQLRRVAAEVAVVLLAVGAITSLRLRGVRASAGDPVADLLLAAAPALGLAAGALLLVRAAPLLLHGVLRAVTRSRGAVAMLAAVQARATAVAALPLLTITVATGLVAVLAVLGATARAGQVDASWAAVGAEVTVTTEPGATLPDVAAAVAARPGVDQVLAARVESGVELRVAPTGRPADLLAVDAAGFARLLASTPLPDAPGLALLAPGGTGVPALVGPGVPLDGRAAVTVSWNGERVPVDPVGRAPDLAGAGLATVVVDAAALGEAVGGFPLPNTLWVTGPGAAAAVAGTPELAGADVASRQEWLADQRADPLVGGLTLVAAGSAAVLLLMAGLAALLGAAAGAPARGRTLAVLRTQGLTGRQARRITRGELLPPVLLAALTGAGVGTGVAALLRTSLEVGLLTGRGGTPELVVPGAVLLVLVPLVLAVGAVVATESATRRRERLGQVLRVG